MSFPDDCKAVQTWKESDWNCGTTSRLLLLFLPLVYKCWAISCPRGGPMMTPRPGIRWWCRCWVRRRTKMELKISKQWLRLKAEGVSYPVYDGLNNMSYSGGINYSLFWSYKRMVLATVFIFHIKAFHPDIDLCFFRACISVDPYRKRVVSSLSNTAWVSVNMSVTLGAWLSLCVWGSMKQGVEVSIIHVLLPTICNVPL